MKALSILVTFLLLISNPVVGVLCNCCKEVKNISHCESHNKSTGIQKSDSNCRACDSGACLSQNQHIGHLRQSYHSDYFETIKIELNQNSDELNKLTYLKKYPLLSYQSPFYYSAKHSNWQAHFQVFLN